MGEVIVRLECLVRNWRMFHMQKSTRDDQLLREMERVRIFYSCADSWQQVEQFLAHNCTSEMMIV